ncbi:MAG: hypothetical protein H6736_21085 [Alphaproteobacteria bacterium]|nr:hypothetical protein [Alphaproteobacteria bacterium]
MSNSLLVNGHPTAVASEIKVENGAEVTVTSSAMQQGAALYGPSNITVATAPVDDAGCPLPGSALVDVGDNSLVTSTVDLFGDPRIVNGVVDIGACEAP